ncbi:MAG: methyltransferase domain-containing protein [Beijerinckiaceae bacterium]|nr:methyltransferase domain-containing protein [Beijerinckiaceae bacterium]
MALDVVDLRTFYSTPLGQVARRLVSQILRERWSNCVGLSVMGIGYATPYLGPLREEAVRVLAFMPAEQGVVNWPAHGLSASALVESSMLPLPDSCMDRVIVVHALETLEHPRDVLAEIWRILTPGGRVIVVAPNRRGLWSRVDTTPFGQGQPFSKSQLRELLRETLFSPIHWAEALYVPPFARPFFLKAAPVFEAIGVKLALPGAGLHLVEATKQLYRPVPARRAARRLRRLEPTLAPSAVPPMSRGD